MSYYYLIASLPALTLGQAPITEDDFQTRCQAELTDRDLQKVQELASIPAGEAVLSTPFAGAWNDLEIQLRNAIARTRAARRQLDTTAIVRPHGGFSTRIEEAVENAWGQPNPLAREQALDQLRWLLLDDLTGPDPFRFDVILAYTLKRRLAERWARMDDEKGWQSVQQTIEQQPAGQGRDPQPEPAGSNAGPENRGTHESK